MLGAKVGGFGGKHQRSGTDALTGGGGSGTDMGDSDTCYNAIHIIDDGNAGGLDGGVSDNRIVSTDGAKVNFEVETRQADGDSSNADAMSRERRLTLKQLERFRRAMAKRSRRGSRAGSRWGNGQQVCCSLCWRCYQALANHTFMYRAVTTRSLTTSLATRASGLAKRCVVVLSRL